MSILFLETIKGSLIKELCGVWWSYSTSQWHICDESSPPASPAAHHEMTEERRVRLTATAGPAVTSGPLTSRDVEIRHVVRRVCSHQYVRRSTFFQKGSEEVRLQMLKQTLTGVNESLGLHKGQFHPNQSVCVSSGERLDEAQHPEKPALRCLILPLGSRKTWRLIPSSFLLQEHF